ncbi:hypothetical protein [Nocardioides sp. SYSU DS0651]|uniref:hypothetical protein n=1 Tax=Nocardioides sp. SYSU DS0651 TaxID=3415955 RepID=UPI003F4B8654
MIRAVVPVLCAFVVTATAAPARAGDQTALSWDGRSWATVLSEPLFSAERRWVPGDADTANFYVLNRGASDASLTVAVRAAAGRQALASGAVVLRARVAGGRWVPLPNGREGALPVGTVGQGEQVGVDVRVSLRDAATNRSQARRLALHLQVTLVEESAVRSGGRDGSSLPPAGSVVPHWLVLLGAALVGGGLAMAVRREAVR